MQCGCRTASDHLGGSGDRQPRESSMECHLTLAKMAIIRKSTNNKFGKGCGEKGTFLHCWWECKLVQPLWRIVWRFLEKLKTELPSNPAIALLDIYPEKTNLMFITALFTMARTWTQAKCPSTEERIKKLWYVYTVEYYSAIKMNEIMPWLDLGIIVLTEVSQRKTNIIW